MRIILLSASRALVRVLLAMLPGAARAIYGAALLDTFARLQRDARSGRALLVYSVREITTLAMLVVREWLMVMRSLGREVRTGVWAGELRQAARGLRRAPLYTLAVTVTIGIGMAGVAVVFSVVRVALLAPLPYGNPEQLVRLYETPYNAYSGATTSIPNVLAWQERVQTLRHIVLVSAGGFATVRQDDRVFRARAARVSRGTWELLATRPLLGALPEPTDFEAGGVRWVVVTHAFWKTQLNGDTAVVGRALRIDGADAQVAAVMPAGFTFPDGGTELFLPLRITPGIGLASPNGRWARLFQAYARLRPAATLAAARAELHNVSLALQQEFGPPNQGMIAYPRSLKASMLGDTRSLMLILLCSAGLVLLVAGSNVAALSLVRTAARERETAIRVVHGASRSAIARHLGSEILLVCALGTALAVYLAALLSPVAMRLVPAALPHASPSTWHHLLIALALGALTALVLLVAVLQPRATLPLLARSLVAGGARTTGTRRQLRTRSALVAGQIAFAIALLVMGGALLRSYLALVRQPVGFHAQDITLVSASTPGQRYADPGRVVQFYDALLERVRALPGVPHATLMDVAPLDGGGTGWTFVPEGKGIEAGREPSGITYTIGDDYLSTLRIPLLAGRALQPIDTFPLAEGVLVSATLARQQFGSAASAIGRRISLGAVSSGNPLMTIVGVIGDVRDGTLAGAPRQLIYRRHAAQTTVRTMTLALASTVDPLVLSTQVSQIVRQLNPDVPTYNVQSLQSVVAAAATRERFTATLAAGFGLLALLLACVGVIGLLGEMALQQRRAQAIRLALGASRNGVLASAGRSSTAVTLVGAVLGTALAWFGSNAIEPFVFGVPPLDVATLLAGVSAFLLIGIVAAVVPAWRTTRGALVGVMRAE
jgi:predicted permease